MSYDLENRKEDGNLHGNNRQLYVFVLGDEEVDKSTFLHNLFSQDKRKKASKSVGGDIHIKHVELEKGANLKVELIEIASDFKKSQCLEIFVDYIFEQNPDIPLSRFAVLFLFDSMHLKSLYSMNDWLPWLGSCIAKNTQKYKSNSFSPESKPLLKEYHQKGGLNSSSPSKPGYDISDIPLLFAASKSDHSGISSIKSHPPPFLKHVFPDKRNLNLILENQEPQIRDFLEAVSLRSQDKQWNKEKIQVTLGLGNFDKLSHKTKLERIQDNVVHFLKRIFFIQ